MPVADAKILERVAQGLRVQRPVAATGAPADEAERAAAGGPGPSSGGKGSILVQAAAVYGAKPDQPEATPGTGFDPVAAALFEALVEGAFLVAHADGVVDDEERAAFEQVVASAATGSSVSSAATAGGAANQVHALLSDLGEALAEDGLDRRIEILAHSVSRPEHKAEVLRVAALVAHVSGGVSDPERSVMDKLASRLELEATAVEQAIAEAAQALSA
jgi:tellurite resistance protein